MYKITIHTANGTKQIVANKYECCFTTGFFKVTYDSGVNFYRVDDIDEIEIIKEDKS